MQQQNYRHGVDEVGEGVGEGVAVMVDTGIFSDSIDGEGLCRGADWEDDCGCD